jgi:two-component system sensor histidine kinase YesM
VVSLNRRFNTVFVLLVGLPLVLAFLLMSWLYMAALLGTVSNQTQELMEQIAQTIENELNSVSVLAATLNYDEELRDAANDWAGTANQQKVAATWRLTKRLGSIFTVANRIGAIAVWMNDGSVLPVSNYPNIRSFQLARTEAFRQAKASPNQVFIADSLSGVTDNGGGRFILSAVISPGRDQGGRAIDAILVMFRVPYLDQFTGLTEPAGKASLTILGRDGQALLSGLPAALSAPGTNATLPLGSSELALGGRSYLVNTRTLDLAQWRLLLTMDKATVTHTIMKYQWYLYPALALMFGLFLVYSMVFFSRVTRPIKEVMENMRRFASGRDPVPVRLDGIQELAELSGDFDFMVAEIRRLEGERRQQSDRRLVAEIQALQFQINPHFVANTLNSIRMMALAAHNDAIRDMTQALIRILADSYASTESLTTLAGEIANIKNYLFIMKVRFGEHFQVVYDVAPDTLACQVLRMGLQPLVENAVLHGFAGLARQGLLTIRSRREDEGGALVLEVEDNGVGMEDSRRAALLAAPSPAAPGQGEEGQESFNRIGIRNVHERIRLNFGDGFGLTIRSAPGAGTTVRVTLPWREGR